MRDTELGIPLGGLRLVMSLRLVMTPRKGAEEGTPEGGAPVTGAKKCYVCMCVLVQYTYHRFIKSFNENHCS